MQNNVFRENKIDIYKKFSTGQLYSNYINI